MATAAAATTTERKKDPKINPPDVYDGNKRNFSRFWQQVELYMIGAPEQFSTDGTKIAFVLSYLRKGDADSWAESFQTMKSAAATAAGQPLSLGTWDQFVLDIKAAFKSEYAEKDAIHDLASLYMQKGVSAEDHVAQFKTLVVRSGLKEEKDLMAKFENSLRPKIRRLISFKGEPKTLQEWYDAASLADNNDRRLEEAIERSKGRPGTQIKPNKSQKSVPKLYTPSYRQTRYTRDPNAMDVDALSTEERDRRLKRGACFVCNEVGHLAREHRNPNFRPGTNTNRNASGQTYAKAARSGNGGQNQAKSIAQQIRNLSQAEKAKVYQETFGADEDEPTEELGEGEGEYPFQE